MARFQYIQHENMIEPVIASGEELSAADASAFALIEIARSLREIDRHLNTVAVRSEEVAQEIAFIREQMKD